VGELRAYGDSGSKRVNILVEQERIDLDLVNDYREKYVVFLDLLGFRELVKKIGQDVLERHRVVEALKLVRDTLCQNPAIDLRFTYFSDCIVLSAEHTAHALWEIFQSIELLTFNLLQYDIFVRGGLSAGLTHHGKDFVFGTAVIEAYDLEREKASCPLVLLSLQVAQDAMKLGPDFTQWLKEDGSARYFVNYLMRYADYTPERQVGKVILEYPAKRIAYFISQRLNNDKDGVLKKAQWFQTYWNGTVGARGVLPRIERGATLTKTQEGPTIILRRLVAPVTVRG
jgi:hypothetical protein